MPSLAPQNGNGDSFFGVRVPKSMWKPISDFLAKFLGNMSDNPVAIILAIMLAVHLGGLYFGVQWLANDAIPRHLDQIEAGYAKQRLDFERATEKAHKDFQAEREREREFMRELKESLKEIARNTSNLDTLDN